MGWKLNKLKTLSEKMSPSITGALEIELLGQIVERNIDFTIETMPTGLNHVSVTIAEPLDYPLVPLMQKLKQFIANLDENGGLPG
jgi:hypothetical protein